MSPSGSLGPPGLQVSTQAYHAGKGPGGTQTGLYQGRLAGHYFMVGSWSGPHLEDHGKWDLVKSLRIWENSVWGVGDLLMVLDDEDQIEGGQLR